MISTDIVNEIAHLIRQRDVSLKDPKEVKEIKAKAAIATPIDEVQLSKTAEAYTHAAPAAGSTSPAASTAVYENEQGMKVERLKALVNSGNYKMDPKMVESIATNIAKMLIGG